MKRKDKLEALIDEGNKMLHFIKHQNKQEYLIWKEKVEATIEREYGKDSTEYKKITHTSTIVPILSSNTVNQTFSEQYDQNISNIIVKLKAWAELEED